MFSTKDLALVTGAASGIGLEVCKLMLEQGAVVVGVDIKTPTEPTDTKNYKFLQCDVSKKTEVANLLTRVREEYKTSPNIAVNCAGLILHEPLLQLTEETFDRLFGVNVKGTMWVTQEVCKALLEDKKQGSVVNVSSIFKQGAKNFSLYSSSKGAVESFSKAAAKEFGRDGIRINVVSPGVIDTPLQQTGGITPEMVEYMKNINPMNRIGTAKEVAETIAFLACEKSSYVNGSVVHVHGGLGSG